MPIDTVDELHEHLQVAIGFELATMPPYLYAMYSIADPASPAAKLIRSVATEEMLHAALIANVLLGVGGEPRFYSTDTIPSYPGPLPHRIPELTLELRACDVEVVASMFLSIERPSLPGSPDEPDDFESQGQFYHSLESALRRLDDGTLFARPQVERQLRDPDGYHAVKFDDHASGGLVTVDDLDSALRALDVPVNQGEGAAEHVFADPGHRELTHHAKFLRLADGTVPIGDVLPAVSTPRSADMPPDVRPVAEFANALYSYLFVVYDRLLAGDVADRHEPLRVLYGVMSGMLPRVARYLMTLPADARQVWGPPFEFHHFEQPDRAEDELRRLGGALAAHEPLAPTLRHLRRLPTPADR